MEKRLKIVFMGTPEFAVPSLQSLIKQNHSIVGVFCQPPKPAHRGQQIQKCPVQIYAEQEHLKVYTPIKLSDPGTWELFQSLTPDVVVVVAYGALLPERYLNYPPYGCLNVHGSLLPRWRGASPIQSSICAGDKESGITLMEMTKELDAGRMIAQKSCPILPDTTAASLHDALKILGASLLEEKLLPYCEGKITPIEQDEPLVTYAPKLTRDSGKIDWNKSALELERQIRGFYPWPGSWFLYNGEVIKVHRAKVITSSGAPGTVLDENLIIACAEAALQPTVLQRPGKKPMDTSEFLRGYPIHKGTRL